MNMRTALLFTVLLLLTTCEGFKVLTLHNASNSKARVTIKPGIGMFDNRNIANYPNTNFADSVTRILEPSSSMILLSIFTYTMFRVRIQARDLRINYLRLETDKNTILADSKEEIIDLLTDKRTKYTARKDRDKGITNSRNFGNIFIRE